jgi:hypothetical protein
MHWLHIHIGSLILLRHALPITLPV